MNRQISREDRNLTELSAECIGLKIKTVALKDVNGDFVFIGYRADAEEWARGWYDPLANNHDAFLLMVAANLECCADDSTEHMPFAYARLMNTDDTQCFEPIITHPAIAMRRAIVRCAALIAEKDNKQVSVVTDATQSRDSADPSSHG